MNERTVFETALEKENSAERTAYLDKACAGDAALRQRVNALLRSHEREGQFLDVPAVEQMAASVPQPDPTDATQGDAPTCDTENPSLDFLAASAKPDSLGRLGHYEVLETLGRGGMGVVLKAFDEQLHRNVALKVLAPQLATSALARTRFVREARAAAAIRNEHVIDIHAVVEANDLPYLAMEYVAGVSLQERLDQSGPLPLAALLRIGMQTAAGLAAAHAQGLIHRDIKPSNILLENGVERVKITDFGLARAVDDVSLTQSGVIAGTPQYMSPEQARGEAVDHRADLFSLGSVLYAMCTGRAPFRASGTMAVLKRVCEDAPRAIREVNPETPDWLCAIIAKLQAKDPADRFQSAAEVADLLSQHLAHLQQPALAPMPATSSPLSPLGPGAGGEGRAHARPRRRLALAAAVLLCFIAGLSLTEATGVTNLRATVIRIFTREGTLVVEVDDPTVKVTVEGDGGIVITGAGLHEVRLKPGSYKVQAAKDGKPVRLDQELVTITRGDKQVVRVRLEGETAAAKIAAKGEAGVFVLLGNKGVVVRKFDTLAEAVRSASDGDTIEVRGNGPFVSGPITIGPKALVIRAAQGFLPVIKLDRWKSAEESLMSDGSLVLEGLELHDISEQAADIIWSRGVPLHVANCRFITKNKPAIFGDAGEGKCEVRNCEFASAGFSPFIWELWKGSRLIVENNVMVIGPGGRTLLLVLRKRDLHDVSIQLRRNTITGAAPLGLGDWNDGFPNVPPPGANQGRKWIRVETSENILDGREAFFSFSQAEEVLKDRKQLEPREVEALLLGLFDWRDQHNVYSGPFRGMTMNLPLPSLKNLADWQRFWKTGKADAIEGHVRFQGGDLITKAALTPEQITADDFRLRLDSAGYRAGKDGKDLGADIDLVGPGPAYERWQKTPAYQQWLKDTGQVKK